MVLTYCKRYCTMRFMLYRTLPDLIPDADPDHAAAMAAAERADHDLRVLRELTDIATRLAASLGALVQTRIDKAVKEDRALTPDEIATAAAFDKVAQTARRTVFLRDKLDAHGKTRRESMTTDRERGRVARDEAHREIKKQAVIDGFHDAYAASTPEDDYVEHVERLMEDVEEHLADADEFRGYLDRPVGETIAKLCAALGLDPDACAFDGDTWRIRRPPTEFERTCAEILPPLYGEGQAAKPPGWGAAGKPPDIGDAARAPP